MSGPCRSDATHPPAFLGQLRSAIAQTPGCIGLIRIDLRIQTDAIGQSCLNFWIENNPRIGEDARVARRLQRLKSFDQVTRNTVEISHGFGCQDVSDLQIDPKSAPAQRTLGCTADRLLIDCQPAQIAVRETVRRQDATGGRKANLRRCSIQENGTIHTKKGDIPPVARSFAYRNNLVNIVDDPLPVIDRCRGVSTNHNGFDDLFVEYLDFSKRPVHLSAALRWAMIPFSAA